MLSHKSDCKIKSWNVLHDDPKKVFELNLFALNYMLPECF